jgi:hypothetical protein
MLTCRSGKRWVTYLWSCSIQTETILRISSKSLPVNDRPFHCHESVGLSPSSYVYPVLCRCRLQNGKPCCAIAVLRTDSTHRIRTRVSHRWRRRHLRREPGSVLGSACCGHRHGAIRKQTGRPPWGGRPVQIARRMADRLYWLTEIRSLIKSNVSLGTTFFATNSPFTR